MPENFEIARLWLLGLIPLPLLIYWLIPPLRMKSASLLFPNLAKAQEYTHQKARVSALVKRRNFFAWITLVLIWILLVFAISSPQLVGEPQLKVKTSRNFLIVADISFSMAQTDWARAYASSSRSSARWVCRRTSSRSASSAVSCISSRVTEKGEQGASAI